MTADIESEAWILTAEVGDAVARVLDAVEAARRLTPDPLVRAQLDVILEACVVGDLAAQRLARISRLARGEAAGGEGLLEGPRAPGEGLDQAAADALMAFGEP